MSSARPTVDDPRTGPGHGDDLGRQATLRSFEDLAYRDAFWPRREYEDRCDRLALRALLPATGDLLIEVGAGFGRLANEYAGYREVVLLDASATMLQAARERLGSDGRFRIVEADLCSLPFPDASFDAAVCIRVLHHFEDPRPAIVELARVLRPGGVLVLELANKRNLKAVVAHLLGRSATSPFARGSQPYVGVHLMPRAIGRARSRLAARLARSGESAPEWTASTSFVHAPGDLRSWLRSAGFQVGGRRSVGLFRLPILTSRVPLGLLIGLERFQQAFLSPVTPGPSLFIRAVRGPRHAPK